jgi:hypothetical protein
MWSAEAANVTEIENPAAEPSAGTVAEAQGAAGAESDQAAGKNVVLQTGNGDT